MLSSNVFDVDLKSCHIFGGISFKHYLVTCDTD